MSKRAKYRAERERWLEAHARGEHAYQVAECMNDDAQRALDLGYLAALRRQGFIDEPYPKKPVDCNQCGAGTFALRGLSDRSTAEPAG